MYLTTAMLSVAADHPTVIVWAAPSLVKVTFPGVDGGVVSPGVAVATAD